MTSTPATCRRPVADRRIARRLLGALVVLVGVLAVLSPGALAGAQSDSDPQYSVDTATLDEALDCDPFTHPDTEPVLLVHGTFTAGHEQYDWNYALMLRATGHDVCIITYPNRGLDDMQVSAEYVSRAIQRIHAESGRKVDMVGHSQGALMPRWSIKWWSSVRAAVDDFVLLAGPNHGTTVAGGGSFPGGQPAVFFQMQPDSAFIRALNADDETPGDVHYTSIYTQFDELVQPVDPPTAALDLGRADPNVTNLLIQDICPLRAVDHLSIGTTDALTHELVLDALDNDGPLDVDRVGPDAVLCNLPDQYVVPETFPNIVGQFQGSAEEGFPAFTPVEEEPPLREYARSGSTDESDAPDAQEPAPSSSAEPRMAAGQVEAAATLPETGRVIPLLGAGIAVGVALLLRAGRSRLDP